LDRPRHRALVTGAAGFIGSHVVEGCQTLGMEVVATDDLSGGFAENVPAAAVFVEGDLRDPAFVASLWRHAPYDFIYHIGAYAAEGLSHFVRRFNYDTNLLASVNLINQAIIHRVERFIFTSSIAVYGSGQTPMREGQTPEPEDPYGISKYAVELDLKAAHKMFGLDYTIFRPHNVYGERQNVADSYRNVIGIFMSALLRGEAMPIFGDGKQTRAFSHIDDVAPLIVRGALEDAARNETFNVGADTPSSVLELATEVAASLELPCRVKHLPPRNEVVHAFSDHAKTRSVFDPPEAVDLRAGLARMASWVRREGLRPPIEFAGEIEVTEKLPASWAKNRR
jgi:UDP-glucose 4-epimerase